MNRILFISAIIFVLLLVAPTALYAEDSSSSPEATSTSESTSSPEATVREKLQEAISERKSEIEEARREAKLKFQENREEFKKKLEGIRDEKKKEILEKLVNKFDSLNEKWVNHWKNILEKLSEILDKMDLRAQKFAENGADLTAYNETSAAARTKISSALASLEEQAANTYLLESSTEKQFGAEVKSVTSQFKGDIKSTHELVKSAREAVRSAFFELKKLNTANNLND